MTLPASLPPSLEPLDAAGHAFASPVKCIHTHADLPTFKNSLAYERITSFIVHLNASVCPLDAATDTVQNPEDFTTNSNTVTVSSNVAGINGLLQDISELVDSTPPDPGPRRFGNAAFRKWIALVEKKLESDNSGVAGVDKHLPTIVRRLLTSNPLARAELLHYLIRSFGSPERLDYGTGHELSFAAFLCGIWVLGGFKPGRDEKALVLRCFDAYFKLVRKLVLTFTLEPAGSHGVWGLDDHMFLPYIYGSAQLTTNRPNSDFVNGHGLPNPGEIVKRDMVERERNRYLYFDAIGFIYEVKKGPFWEHSPILFDISGVQKGWGKINEVNSCVYMF